MVSGWTDSVATIQLVADMGILDISLREVPVSLIHWLIKARIDPRISILHCEQRALWNSRRSCIQADSNCRSVSQCFIKLGISL